MKRLLLHHAAKRILRASWNILELRKADISFSHVDRDRIDLMS
ncbi:hypothetical protein [Acetobacter sp. DmW_136]|nr:hypothetical protein [Acetobacter sp. DmW_136]